MSLTEIIFHEYEKKALKIMIIILYHVHVPIYFFIPPKKKKEQQRVTSTSKDILEIYKK
jgi:hypothetical protein